MQVTKGLAAQARKVGSVGQPDMVASIGAIEIVAILDRADRQGRQLQIEGDPLAIEDRADIWHPIGAIFSSDALFDLHIAEARI